jgi:hypothetical protein
MVERLLVPRRIWKGGWCISRWNSRRRRWEVPFDIHPDLECGPFLKYQQKWARAQLACFQALYPRSRFRLQPVEARWILDFYDDLVWYPDDPDREWLEVWGGGSPLWRLLGRQPA